MNALQTSAIALAYIAIAPVAAYVGAWLGIFAFASIIAVLAVVEAGTFIGVSAIYAPLVDALLGGWPIV